MKVRSCQMLLIAAALPIGCQYVPKSSVVGLQQQNQVLAEQNRAQLTEIENLKVHARNLSEQLIRSEAELAALEKRYAGLPAPSRAADQRASARAWESPPSGGELAGETVDGAATRQK